MGSTNCCSIGFSCSSVLFMCVYIRWGEDYSECACRKRGCNYGLGGGNELGTSMQWEQYSKHTRKRAVGAMSCLHPHLYLVRMRKNNALLCRYHIEQKHIANRGGSRSNAPLTIHVQFLDHSYLLLCTTTTRLELPA